MTHVSAKALVSLIHMSIKARLSLIHVSIKARLSLIHEAARVDDARGTPLLLYCFAVLYCFAIPAYRRPPLQSSRAVKDSKIVPRATQCYHTPLFVVQEFLVRDLL